MNRANKQNNINPNRTVRMIIRKNPYNRCNNENIRINKPTNKATVFTNIEKPYGRSTRLIRPKSFISNIKSSLMDGGRAIVISFCISGIVNRPKVLEAFLITLASYGAKTKKSFNMEESIVLIAIGENLNKNEVIMLDKIIEEIKLKSKLFSLRKKFTKESIIEILQKLETEDVIELRGNYLVLKEKIILKSKR